MSREEIDNEFNQLIETDKQVQFSYNAVKNYNKEIEHLTHDNNIQRNKINKINNNDDTNDTIVKPNLFPMKRHIINIDNISKINYDVIRNTPGNISTTYSPKYEEIDAIRARYYRSGLHKMHDKFIYELNNKFEEEATKYEETTTTKENEDIDLPLNEQIDILYKIQENLLQDYKMSRKEYIKWFQLKEVMLDANVELDLYSKNEWIRHDTVNNSVKPSKFTAPFVNSFRNPKKGYKINKINLGINTKDSKSAMSYK
ncbi:ino eighty subunit 3 [Monosporozyma unispora]|nr:hypothetical protein C6P44_004365 [Kazachstania unispora]